jgi:hypothetical protein
MLKFAAAFSRTVAIPVLLVLLAGCALQPAKHRPPSAAVQREIMYLMPSRVSDAAGWAADVDQALAVQDIPATTQNLCAILAVTQQESGFQVNPAIRNLSDIARKALMKRAAAHHIPGFVVDAALMLRSPNGQTYSERLKHVRTEKDLSDLFQDLISKVPLGKRLFGGLNPVHTAGPMQVSIAFAEQHEQDYPYPIEGSVRNEVFTRRGGLYFGILHLLGYPTHYPKILYRFADYNAGWYASRNAAFQHAVAVASGRSLARDGDLLRPGAAMDAPGATEAALRTLGPALGMDDASIRRALGQGESPRFDQGPLYRQVFALAERRFGKPLPRALLPEIDLHSPKITRRLSTAWFAQRVDARWKQCMAR